MYSVAFFVYSIVVLVYLENGHSGPQHGVEVFPITDAVGSFVDDLGASAFPAAVSERTELTTEKVHPQDAGKFALCMIMVRFSSPNKLGDWVGETAVCHLLYILVWGVSVLIFITNFKQIFIYERDTSTNDGLECERMNFVLTDQRCII